MEGVIPPEKAFWKVELLGSWDLYCVQETIYGAKSFFLPILQ